MSLIDELKRRNVFRVGVAYLIVAWLLLQVSDTLVPALLLPDWFRSGVAFFLILGFPLALFFAWAFELTPEGFRKEKDIEPGASVASTMDRRLDLVIIGLLALTLGYFGYDKFVIDPGRDAASIEAAVQSAQEQTAESVQVSATAKSIAVLAFVNMSDDTANEYFSDGISEEILNLLASIPELRVTSRSSAFSLKGQNLDVPAIAARLNVAHVLEGSVRKSGNKVRITAQLIEVASDVHLWSETYDRELENIFLIQDEIAASVVDALQIALLVGKPKAVDVAPEAYALFLQARHLREKHTLESAQQSENLIERALDVAPDFAPAWTELASVYFEQGSLGIRSMNNAWELARPAIEKSLNIDSEYALAWAMLAKISNFYDWDFQAAEESIQKARMLAPGDSEIIHTAGGLAATMGRLDEAIELYRQSVARDPLRHQAHARLGYMLYSAHRLEEAVESMRTAQSLNPGGAFLNYALSVVVLENGDASTALETVQKETSDPMRLVGLARIFHVMREAEASDAALEELIEKYASGTQFQIAQIYAFRGEIDNAFYWLEQAYEFRDGAIAYMLLEPDLTILHDDPRWEDLLQKLDLPH